MDLLRLARAVKDRAQEPFTELAAMARIVADPRLPLLLVLNRTLFTPLYRASFLAAAAGSGVLGCLAARPCDLESLAEHLESGPDDRQRLRAWLDIGVQLGELDRREGCYRLRSRTAKALAQVGNDAVAGALEELLRFHVPALRDAPRMLKDGSRFELSDQDGLVIARSTLVVRGFVEEAISRTLPRTTPVRLLEVGCGSGAYVRYAAGLNPRLTALAVDLQAEVAGQAAKNMAHWGLADRVETRAGDLRTLDLQPQFDVVTLHNNIYYFPEEERAEVLARARSFLAPGGTLLLTSSCRGSGTLGLDVLNLWFEYAGFGGPLPLADELLDQLRAAGFDGVRATRLLPGQAFRSFVGTNPVTGSAVPAPARSGSPTTAEEAAS
ncbi:SAM-dependent methyltransferase [Streptomyces flavofungini]|uniref:Methyltransferase domain-containing protein n=1 Tax=Streptomyces flavofungini TaxID=68200 RepID=A0ABS0X1T1_9ACTN|nr:class I SAM-dependent methyltransferase [Streptomyces flavofungini]MBJ3807148.1 methyltransferase domain-containing protein [Streptomyces flavofungini]GHC74752.1 methyltransferase [Streptomyces flavofungini]